MRSYLLPITLLIVFVSHNLFAQNPLLEWKSLSQRLIPSEPPYYLILSPHAQVIDRKIPTRIIVTGDGHGKGEGAVFQEAAVSLALKYQEAYPNDQVILFFPVQGSLEKQMRIISNWQLQIVDQGNELLGADELMMQIKKFAKIHALHLFSHAWKTFAAIQGPDVLSFYTDLTPLQERLSRDAFLMVHGCNSGWELGPYLARTLGVPVAGALTSTNFERLHSNGNFYFNDAPEKPLGPWASKNNSSYQSSKPCYRGACMRMKPDNHPYQGLHGKLAQGLPYYKFFCPYSWQNTCQKTAAKALLGFIDLKPLSANSMEDEFKTVARNWFCPIHKATAIRDECISALMRAENESSDEINTYSPFQGPLLKCDFYGCMESEENEKPDTFVKEYRWLMDGFRLLD